MKLKKILATVLAGALATSAMIVSTGADTIGTAKASKQNISDKIVIKWTEDFTGYAIYKNDSEYAVWFEVDPDAEEPTPADTAIGKIANDACKAVGYDSAFSVTESDGETVYKTQPWVSITLDGREAAISADGTAVYWSTGVGTAAGRIRSIGGKWDLKITLTRDGNGFNDANKTAVKNVVKDVSGTVHAGELQTGVTSADSAVDLPANFSNGDAALGTGETYYDPWIDLTRAWNLDQMTIIANEAAKNNYLHLTATFVKPISLGENTLLIGWSGKPDYENTNKAKLSLGRNLTNDIKSYEVYPEDGSTIAEFDIPATEFYTGLLSWYTKSVAVTAPGTDAAIAVKFDTTEKSAGASTGTNPGTVGNYPATIAGARQAVKDYASGLIDAKTAIAAVKAYANA